MEHHVQPELGSLKLRLRIIEHSVTLQGGTDRMCVVVIILCSLETSTNDGLPTIGVVLESLQRLLEVIYADLQRQP